MKNGVFILPINRTIVLDKNLMERKKITISNGNIHAFPKAQQTKQPNCYIE